MRGDLTARLLRFDGRPSAAALLAIAGCVAIAFAAAFVTRVSRGDEAPSSGAAVPESRLTGEVISASDRAASPQLRHAAALPAMAPDRVRRRHEPPRRQRSRPVEKNAAAPAATAAPTQTSTPEPVATATPVATSAPPVSPPASSPPATEQPSSPAPTPGQTFDSSG